jgi:hypothetical protein
MTLVVERRRPAIDAELLARVLLAFALVAVLALVTNLPAIAEMRFPDPDDTLRLQQVRDLIAGQGWFDVTQYRVNAAEGGVPMHWSRLVDLPVAGTILLLRPLFGQPMAEMIALIVVPLITFGIAIFLAGRIAWRLLNAEATTFACLALALSVPVVAQLRPLRIDHHGWQIVLALLAVNGLMARLPRAGGWVTGLALALWVSISVEGLPLAAAIVGITALRWLRRDEGKQWLIATMQALAAGSIAIFLLTRGFGNLATYCDAISPVHLAIFAWGALALTGLGALGRHPLPFTIGGFLVTGAGAAAIVALWAPQCATGGGFAALDPLVHEFWYLGVAEGQPLWAQSYDVMLQITIPPLIALWTAVRLAKSSDDWLRDFWIDYALLLAASLLISIFVARAGAVTGALAAVPLGWQIREWIRAARRIAQPTKRALALAGVALVLVPAMPVTLFTMAVPATASPLANTTRTSSCMLQEAAPALDALPKGEILAPLDIGPMLVYATKHGVIATGHHRGSEAMRQTISAFLGSDEEAHELLRKRGTSYVAICPDLGEPALYIARAPDGFAASLVNGKAPAWLEPVPMEQGIGLKIWKVKDLEGSQ